LVVSNAMVMAGITGFIPRHRTAVEFINAFSSGAESQRAVLNVIFGKAQAQGRHPVSLKGFFKCEY
jgi:hypothetical protein